MLSFTQIPMMRKSIIIIFFIAITPALLYANAHRKIGTNTYTSNPLSAPADSTFWDLLGKASFTDYQGRKSIMLDGGAAFLKDFEMRDAIIDFDVSTPANRGFFGVQFRIDSTGTSGEYIYLRQHYSGQPDAIQYTPLFGAGLNWQLYNGPGFTGAVDIPQNQWFHVRIIVKGAQAYLYVTDMNTPALVMSDLKSGVEKGVLALAVITGATYFSNFKIETTPDAVWQREQLTMPPGILTGWGLSPSYDAVSTDPERPLTAGEIDTIPWQMVEAEAPGLVAILRYRNAPGIRASFINDFSKRLEPQPGSKMVYARCIINSENGGLKKLNIGYSDEVSVFLNGQILYRGRSSQNFRDTKYLGIVDPESEAVYLQLKKGENELILAVTEIAGGGWGFICRLEE